MKNLDHRNAQVAELLDRRRSAVGGRKAGLLPWRNVLENVLLTIEVKKLPWQDGNRRARELIRLVGLADFEEKYPFELSGGMQQRAAIARSLVSDPALLLMDEPFGALDALTRETIALELQQLWMLSRKTILFVTHSISEAVFPSDRVVVMSERPSRVKEVIEIALPRPRDFRMAAESTFGAYVLRIRELLSANGAL